MYSSHRSSTSHQPKPGGAPGETEIVTLLRLQPLIDLDVSTPARWVASRGFLFEKSSNSTIRSAVSFHLAFAPVVRCSCPAPHTSSSRPSQLAALLLANNTNSSAESASVNGSALSTIKFSFSVMEETREGLGFSYYNLISVTAEGALSVRHAPARCSCCPPSSRTLASRTSRYGFNTLVLQTPVTINVTTSRCARAPLA